MYSTLIGYFNVFLMGFYHENVVKFNGKFKWVYNDIFMVKHAVMSVRDNNYNK